MRSIAIDDLVYYLVGILSDPRAYGQCYDVGNDDVLTNSEMLDVTAAVLGRLPPVKLKISRALVRALAPSIKRLGKLPQGAMSGMLDSLEANMSGNPAPIRALLPHPLLSFSQAVKLALSTK